MFGLKKRKAYRDLVSLPYAFVLGNRATPRHELREKFATTTKYLILSNSFSVFSFAKEKIIFQFSNVNCKIMNFYKLNPLFYKCFQNFCRTYQYIVPSHHYHINTVGSFTKISFIKLLNDFLLRRNRLFFHRYKSTIE